ncbi:aromatic amino acid hydroxylase [Tenacibaculum finnmarkense genomovar finnmarkense]|uniref:aromatic amino acid hydroxylase n=1 Tax=Tenacibaculum finnmarkense TaxID=2781243 RepID=UPI001E57F346|nr:aromatic amino acid hydroxylase [Tenacibaculum finnmarkense]MCD8416517.1 aromatic amino acid hydroxylase [Tenacibaculum finnmarkense genomovar finnmarkense]MCG8185282.1 aromatic amino acid hydroxylase [Tenacibaculum finnmarkense genomovar finnmarkense]MCG8201451.1 aromatic amino acid hydroxylase [Tenacibaculum finnmarkense genomovar finnmarkense]MCG8209216.1 aromatic amino acid hydroxylase [Tenacibaculum finnmarkense genomovar finnmarkense]MCG8212011.1 aromatic amino acid hydroxylase [Tenac
MNPHFELNDVTKKLPKHLHKFIVKQPYNEYTAQNQAVWRYVMRMNVDYLGKVAHSSYLKGLEKTGISINNIPYMEGMNRILKEIGWSAVSVDGFIPPNAFMEFQAYNVLVIASDIRTINHIEYTPAPDIIHEAAGHAPIIANPEYSEYLRRFGEIGSKAISSSKDYEMYEAIRLLSILKEDPNATKKSIDDAQEKVTLLQDNMGELSEMAQIRNLHWWTVEYGLIGTPENPKIYGAGLLSSIGESKWCMQSEVKKVPYSVAAATQNFDITKPQPQLFVTPNFAYLSLVLNEFANTMALRTGGLKGVEKLINSKNLGTVELSTGIQISGMFTNVIEDEKGEIAYIQTTGNTALSNRDKELIGHGISYHAQGFGSPVGKLKGINLPIEDMSPRDLEAYGIYEGEIINLEFESGVLVTGKIITGTRDLRGKILIVSLKDCRVTYKEQILFDPSWGIYDMAIGKELVSAYSGPADVDSFGDIGKVSETKTHKIQYSVADNTLYQMYADVRKYRKEDTITENIIERILKVLKNEYPKDWLLVLELYELAFTNDFSIKISLKKYLESLKSNKGYKALIENGLYLLSEK